MLPRQQNAPANPEMAGAFSVSEQFRPKLAVKIGIMKLGGLLALTSALALAGCATEPPPVSERVQQAYESGKAVQPVAKERTKPLIVMLGDSFTAGNDETPGAVKYGYADRAADELGWDRYNLAQGGTGYLAPGGQGSTPYAGVVYRVVNLAPDIIMIGGGINDVKYPLDQVATAADLLYKEFKAKLPEAKIVVMAPIAPGGPEGEYSGVLPVRDVLKATAEANGVAFIDPIAENWMPTKEGVVGPSNFHPNETGHKMLASKLVAGFQALGLP